MKINKILAIALTALTFTACSDDDVNYNTAADVTVEMQDATLKYAEDQLSNTQFFKIPIVVTGESNGRIDVSLEIGEIGENPAVAGENFVITSTNIIIPEGRNVGYIEFYPKGDDVENPDRQFTITIVDAKGAKIGTQATTVVTLLDNELMIKNAYTDIQGAWTASFTDPDDGTSYDYPVIVTGVAENQSAYLKDITIVGWRGYDDFAITGQISCDPSTGETVLSFKMGQKMGEGNFTGLGLCDVKLIGATLDFYYKDASSFTAVSNPELTEISFQPDGDYLWAGGVYKNGQIQGIWYFEENVKLTR